MSIIFARMKTKLTLLIDEKQIAYVKGHAAKNKTTVSKLLEDYIEKLSAKKNYRLTPEMATWFKSLPKGKMNKKREETIYEAYKEKRASRKKNLH